MIVCAQLPDSAGQFAGAFCVSDLVDYNEKAGTVTLLFAREQHTVPLSKIRYVATDMTEAIKKMSQQEAIERINEALRQHRQSRTATERAASKPAGNRYASIGIGSDAAPSPTKPASRGRGSQQAPSGPPKEAPPAKALSKPRRETKPVRAKTSHQRSAAEPAVRWAQRLSNDSMEIYFPAGAKVTAKLPNGEVDVVETDKPFGKIFRK